MCAVCSSCLTLLGSPDSAGDVLGRARVVSRRRVPRAVFVGFYFNNCSDLKGLFVLKSIPGIHEYQSELNTPEYVKNWGLSFPARYV